jgi:hypothetical protein
VSDKVKASRKLTELENELNTKWEEERLVFTRVCPAMGLQCEPEEKGGGSVWKWLLISASKMVAI